MNLSQFKVIPQSNVRKGEATLENLKPLFVPEVVKPDLVFNEESEKFFITLKFIKEQTENQGFTAITDGISTYLIRTTEDDSNEDLRPKFFRGNKTQYTTSDYLRLLTKDLGNDLFLHETKIEDYQAFLISAFKENPFYDVKNAGVNKTQDTPEIVSESYGRSFAEEPLIQTDVHMFSTELTGITSTEVNQTNEEAFTYTSDLLDQPVEEKIEEPSLF